MGLYSKTAFELLCAQINRDNPDMEVPFSYETVMLLQGPLTTNLGSSGRNTRALFNGIQGSGIVGKIEVFYDRLALNKLYNGSPLKLIAPSSAAVVGDLLDSINETFGLALEMPDIVNPTTSLGTGALQGNVTVTIAATSLSYTGTLTFAWRRAPIGTFPNSGPGTKELNFGSLEAGYFGIVTSAELMDEFGFVSGLFKDETPIGSLMTGPLFWMKFAYKGRFIFVPSRPLMSSVPWNNLYNLGVVYPFEQAQHFTAAGVARARQGKLLTVKEGNKVWRLKPRLPRLAEVDPLGSLNNGGAQWDTGEYWELYRHIHKTSIYGDGIWADLGSQINYASEEVILNTQTGDGSGTFTQAFNLSRTSYFAKSGYPYYRPILEVVNDREIIVPLEHEVYKIEGRLVQPIVNIKQDLDPANKLQHVGDLTWEISSMTTPVMASTETITAKSPIELDYSTTNLPIASVRIDLQ